MAGMKADIVRYDWHWLQKCSGASGARGARGARGASGASGASSSSRQKILLVAICLHFSFFSLLNAGAVPNPKSSE